MTIYRKHNSSHISFATAKGNNNQETRRFIYYTDKKKTSKIISTSSHNWRSSRHNESTWSMHMGEHYAVT